MTKDEAVSWLRAARAVVREFPLVNATGEREALSEALDALHYGAVDQTAMRCRSAAIKTLRYATRMRRAHDIRELKRREARVLGFCAAVLRATVEESEDGPSEVERLRAEVKDLRAGTWLPTVDDVAHSWDDHTTIAEVLAVVRMRLSEGGRS